MHAENGILQIFFYWLLSCCVSVVPWRGALGAQLLVKIKRVWRVSAQL